MVFSPGHGATTLSYDNVMPRYNFPAIFLERIIGSDLPVNLRALACLAERDYEGNLKAEITESETSMIVPTSPSIVLDGAFREKDKLTTGDLKESYPSSTFGPMPPPSNDLNNNWGVLGKACRLDRRCMVDEVHLRRFDGLLENGGVHRCVVASITVKAPVREVWNVSTVMRVFLSLFQTWPSVRFYLEKTIKSTFFRKEQDLYLSGYFISWIKPVFLFSLAR